MTEAQEQPNIPVLDPSPVTVAEVTKSKRGRKPGSKSGPRKEKLEIKGKPDTTTLIGAIRNLLGESNEMFIKAERASKLFGKQISSPNKLEKDSTVIDMLNLATQRVSATSELLSSLCG